MQIKEFLGSHRKLAVIPAGFFLLCAFLGLFLWQKTRPAQPKEIFRLLAPDPSLAPNYLYSPGLQITLTFSQPVDPKGFYYSLNPPANISTKLSPDGRQVFLSPSERWPTESYSLTILKKTRSQTEKELDKDYRYFFSVGFNPRQN